MYVSVETLGIYMGMDFKDLGPNGGSNIMLDWTEFIDMGAFTDDFEFNGLAYADENSLMVYLFRWQALDSVQA